MRARPFTQLFLARIKEPLREPEVLFWIFVFPVLLAVGLGIAFRNKPPEEIAVGVVSGDRSAKVMAALDGDSEIKAELIDEDEAASRIRLGHVDLLIVPGKKMTYRFDPTRPASLVARARVDDTLQRAWGRSDTIEVVEEHVTEPGARYIDFLIPGLIGLNLMSGGLWGVGFAVVDMRTRKLIKRLVASPMRRSEFIGAMMTSRLVFMLFEVVLLLVAGHFIFDVAVRGSILATFVIGVVGALAFGAIGILVASRAEKIETVSGLMNLVMLPMFVFSGVFFSSDRFPDVIQPFVQALPLTMLNDAFRAVIIEGASLGSQLSELAGLVVWGGVSFLLAVKWFRWS
ncbi:MAG TPA: ABC transporter permease [Vicinamibacteria bacterium]|nr:ABC transporter permease [Vicinamibacteria bacterium]